jgi:hypothetical protein
MLDRRIWGELRCRSPPAISLDASSVTGTIPPLQGEVFLKSR